MGGVTRCISAHYHKVGWKDIVDANMLPHIGIIVIENETNRNQPV